jgi:hypothetical protein
VIQLTPVGAVEIVQTYVGMVLGKLEGKFCIYFHILVNVSGDGRNFHSTAHPIQDCYIIYMICNFVEGIGLFSKLSVPTFKESFCQPGIVRLPAKDILV